MAVPISNLTKACTSLLKFKKPIFSEKTLCLSFDDFDLLKKLGGAKHILGYIPDKIKAINVIINEDELSVSFTAMLRDRLVVIMSVSGRHCNKISGVSIHGKKGSAELYNAYNDHITIRDKAGEKKITFYQKKALQFGALFCWG